MAISFVLSANAKAQEVYEGDVQRSISCTDAYLIIPQRKDCQFLYVICAVSDSHIVYGSLRMEPVFMILGHSAAAAAFGVWTPTRRCKMLICGR